MSDIFNIIDIEKQHKNYTNAESQYKNKFRRFKPVRNIMSNPKNSYKDPYKVCLENNECRHECYDDPECMKNVDNYKTLYDNYTPHYNNQITFDKYVHDTSKDLQEDVDKIVEDANKSVEDMLNTNTKQSLADLDFNINTITNTELDDNDDILAELDQAIANETHGKKLSKSAVYLDYIAKECSRRMN